MSIRNRLRGPRAELMEWGKALPLPQGVAFYATWHPDGSASLTFHADDEIVYVASTDNAEDDAAAALVAKVVRAKNLKRGARP